MSIKSNNTKGNPYHDESDGRFTSKNVTNAGFLDTIDDFLNSFDNDISEKNAEKQINVDFKPILNEIVVNKQKRDLIINTLNEQLNLVPSNYKKVILNFLEKTNIPMEIKGQKTAFNYKYDWLGEITNYRLLIKQHEIFDSNNFKSHAQGTALVHEIFHAIDFVNSDFTWLSCTQTLSNGKTLKKILDEDMYNLDMNKLASELAQEYIERRGQRVSELVEGKVLPKRINELLKLQEENRQKRAQDLLHINYMFKKGLFAKYEDYVEAFNSKKSEYSQQISPYKEELDLIDDAHRQAKRELEDDFSIMSDLLESFNVDNELTKVLHYGHGSKYWNEDSNNRAVEFFAECAESDAINKKALAKLEKYFPNAVSGFREILKGLEGE